ncbi:MULTISPECIES: MFS transporter [unclassified Adlercreutzia]|uniref:MFS transporter n=1 Tax=unclassified Adlercreutzia TaxID=2636013 RepID=UPI0013E9BFF5|nr:MULTISPECIES: MFS transporter [unclassified Adlercreutzia]
MAENADLKVAQIRRKRVAYLAVSTVSLLFLGLIYAFSLFSAPMCATFELEKNDVSLTFNIMMMAFCVGAVIGSQIEKVVGVRGSIICAGIMFLVGFAGTGLFGYGSIMAVYLLYGVCGGMGVGIGYNSIIATTNVWFPDKVGFSSGVLMMGFGVSALLVGNLSLSFVASAGLTPVLIALGIATFAVALACAFILKRPPENIIEIMTGKEAVTTGDDPADNDKPLSTPSFYVYWIWAIIVIAIGLATIGSCASDAQLVGLDTAFATMLVGVVSTANGLARIVMGVVYDKTNVKVTMAVNAGVAVIAAGGIFVAFATGMGVFYVIGAVCCGFCYGTVPVATSAFSRQRFGSKNYPLNLSIANLAILFGSLLNIAVQAAVGGAENRLGVFAALLALSAIALADVIPFSKMWNRDMKRLDEARTQAN